MAKIEETKKEFIPYKIVVETQEEHDHLKGLFGGYEEDTKDHCHNYNNAIDYKFYLLIQDLR